jgi:molecular chaperone GrpE
MEHEQQNQQLEQQNEQLDPNDSVNKQPGSNGKDTPDTAQPAETTTAEQPEHQVIDAPATENAGVTEELAQRLAQAEKEAAEYKDQWLRSVAELKNFKRRSDAERTELMKNASASLILKLLPIIDDFERAAASVPPEIDEHPWWAGTKLITQKLRTVLESEGVTPIEAEGTDFDPNWHEAVMYEESEGQEGKVTAELQKGYRLHDRLLRPTMVKVGKG